MPSATYIEIDPVLHQGMAIAIESDEKSGPHHEVREKGDSRPPCERPMLIIHA